MLVFARDKDGYITKMEYMMLSDKITKKQVNKQRIFCMIIPPLRPGPSLTGMMRTVMGGCPRRNM